MLLWSILTCLHQTGNGCWLSSCRGKSSFISPVSALHQQDRNASGLSTSTDQQQQQQWLHRALHKRYTETMLSFSAAPDNSETRPASARCNYSAGKRPQEGQAITTVLIVFSLAFYALENDLHMMIRFRHGHLWTHVCGRGRIALFFVCITLLFIRFKKMLAFRGEICHNR